jgi:hypothetical protein
MPGKSLKRKKKKLNQSPFLKCFICKRIIQGVVRVGGLELTDHDPDLGEPIDEKNKICLGVKFPNLAVPQQLTMV